MTRPTMFDEYGRCIHCGFWHADIDGPAAQLCGEHEARYIGRGGCGCVFKKLPTPVKGKDGLWHAPGVLKPEEIAPTGGGVSLTSVAHPRLVWYVRIWHWLRDILCPRQLDPNSVETIEIEIKERN